MAESGGNLLLERGGGVAHIRVNRPDVLNVLDEPLADALVVAFESVASDPSIRAVVLTGAGRSFMAGGDLTRFRDDLDGAPRTASGLVDSFHVIVRAIKSMPKPVVAGVHGPVAGGGVGLATACDLIVAADTTTFLSAYTKLGTSPDGGTTWSLTRLLGPRRALEFMLLNDSIDAQTALRLGLVNRVVPAADLQDDVMAYARRLAETATGASAAVKRLVGAAVHGGLDDQLDLEKRAFVSAAATPDFHEGITAFFERRPPRFNG